MINYDELTAVEIEKLFDKWFDTQTKQGLTDFRISINETTKDPVDVKREILKMEQHITNGNFEIVSEHDSFDDFPMNIIVKN
jgi:hypothetical protein